MILQVSGNIQGQSNPALSMRCPRCRHQVILEQVGSGDFSFNAPEQGQVSVGHRMCPNADCHAHVFVVRKGHEVLVSYPPERIDFDATALPDAVVEALEEAIACHAQRCYIAAAVMVRKTLEALCRDRQAAGENLKERIEALGNTVVLPQAMIDGLDDLRLLGNDAAHVESRVYDDIGQEEVEVAIDVTKEILKATYQYESIMGRLKGLQREQEQP